MAENRFISLAPDDPDDSDTDMEPIEPCVTEQPREDASADSDHSVYFDAHPADKPPTGRTLPIGERDSYFQRLNRFANIFRK